MGRRGFVGPRRKPMPDSDPGISSRLTPSPIPDEGPSTRLLRIYSCPVNFQEGKHTGNQERFDVGILPMRRGSDLLPAGDGAIQRQPDWCPGGRVTHPSRASSPYRPSPAPGWRVRRNACGSQGEARMTRSTPAGPEINGSTRPKVALGTPLREITMGGATDGNFTAAIGVPTLDGMGPDGGLSNSEREFWSCPASGSGWRSRSG